MPRRMIASMADSAEDPGTGEGAPPGDARNWGRVLDAAGVGACIILGLIVADILTDGRLISRRLRRKDDDDDRAAD